MDTQEAERRLRAKALEGEVKDELQKLKTEAAIKND